MNQRSSTDGIAGAGSSRLGWRGSDASNGVGNTPGRRWLILHSMLETVGSRGYDETTLGEVLGRAGVSTRAFDLEFKDKKDCFLSAFQGEVRRIEAWLADAIQLEETWPAKFRVGLGCLVDLVEAEPNVARALFTDSHAARSVTREEWTRILDRAAEVIDGARLAPDAESPPRIAGKAVAAKIYGLLRSRVDSWRPVRDLAPDLVFHAIRPYFGPEVSHREMLAVTVKADGNTRFV